jgi:hypothetical protein
MDDMELQDEGMRLYELYGDGDEENESESDQCEIHAQEDNSTDTLDLGLDDLFGTTKSTDADPTAHQCEIHAEKKEIAEELNLELNDLFESPVALKDEETVRDEDSNTVEEETDILSRPTPTLANIAGHRVAFIGMPQRAWSSLDSDERVIRTTVIRGEKILDIWEWSDADEQDEIDKSQVIQNELQIGDEWMYCFENGQVIPGDYVMKHGECFYIRLNSELDCEQEDSNEVWDDCFETPDSMIVETIATRKQAVEQQEMKEEPTMLAQALERYVPPSQRSQIIRIQKH